jgi:hypothetical protein
MFILPLLTIKCIGGDYNGPIVISTAAAIYINDFDHVVTLGNTVERGFVDVMSSAVYDNDLYLLFERNYHISKFDSTYNKWEHVTYAPVNDPLSFFGVDNNGICLAFIANSNGWRPYLWLYRFDNHKWNTYKFYDIGAKAFTMIGNDLYFFLDNQGCYTFNTSDLNLEKKDDLPFTFCEYYPWNDKEGGYTCYSNITNMMYLFKDNLAAQYSLDNDSWDNMSNIPPQLKFRRETSCCSCNGTDIYFLQCDDNTSFIFSYSIAGDTWTALWENSCNNTLAWQYPYLCYFENTLYGIQGCHYRDIGDYYDIIVCDLTAGTSEARVNPFYRFYQDEIHGIEGVYHVMFNGMIMGIGGTKGHTH